MNKLLRALAILSIIAVNIGCDQVSKAVVRKHVEAYASFRFFHDHFMLTRVENTGAFLSLGDNIPGVLRIFILSVIPSAFLLMGIWYLIRNTQLSKVTLTGICFVIGGGIGNIFDRIVHGSVTDFLYIDFSPFRTGVFNMADLSITFGALIILIGMNLKNPPKFLRRQVAVNPDANTGEL